MKYFLFSEKKLTDDEKAEVREFLLGKPVIKVQTGIIKAEYEITAIENARKWAEINKQIIKRNDIGNVIFNGKSVKNSLSHGFGQRKLDAVQAIPEAIRSGKVVKISSDYNGKPQKNIIIMAPIQVGKNKSILAVRLVKNIGDDTRFYIHEVVDIPEDNKKGNTIRPPALDLTANPQGGIALYISILLDIWNVK
jgi:CRISPR/Cas system-associated protein Cas5 (RAMP superfamily)